MKHSFREGIKNVTPFFIAITAFVMLAGHKNPGPTQDAASKCCKGYTISIDKLKKFMLDSLHENNFEGGVFSKADLIAAINEVPGDSVYLMNVAKNCNLSRSTDLALTSPQATGVVFASKPGCYPCPPKACCPTKVCATSINRSCITYRNFKGFAEGPAADRITAEE